MDSLMPFMLENNLAGLSSIPLIHTRLSVGDRRIVAQETLATTHGVASFAAKDQPDSASRDRRKLTPVRRSGWLDHR